MNCMQASEFMHKWAVGGPAHGLNERAGAQPHFIDLCRVLGVPEPADPERYCFERTLTSLYNQRPAWLAQAHAALDAAVAAA